MINGARALAAFLFSVAAVTAAADRADGNWWREETPSFRVAFMSGYVMGENVGQMNLAKGLLNDMPGRPCTTLVSDRVMKGGPSFGNMTIGQLVDGATAFYDDYRNRAIKIQFALQFVVFASTGTPKEQLDKMIEEARKHSARE